MAGEIDRPGADERWRVITVRLPESLHAAAKQAAESAGISLNGLCLAAIEHVLSAPARPAASGQESPPCSA